MTLLVIMVLLATPLCATAAGLVVGTIHRNEAVDDSDLVRNFLVVLIMGMTALWGISRTQSVRMLVDPQFRVESAIEVQPLYAAIKRVDARTAEALHEHLLARMLNGVTLSDALAQARPMLTAAATDRLGFADQASRIQWGRVFAASLKELLVRDPALCYRVLAGQSADGQALSASFSIENGAVFQDAVMAVFESADRGMRHEQPAGDQPADFNAAVLEFRAIQAEIEERFGAPIAADIAKKNFTEPSAQSPEQMCAARIYELDAMAKRPKAMAAMLIDSALR